MNAKTLPAFILAAALLTMAGCSAHSPMILHDTVNSTPSGANVAAVPHSRQVLVTEAGLPDGITYQVLETVQVGTVWYGGGEKVDKQMADRARAIGADAVINVKHWRQPSGFAWAAPHGSGQAVKLSNTAALASAAARQGGWF